MSPLHDPRARRNALLPYSVYGAWRLDVAVNRGNYKSLFVLTWFRLANAFGLRRRTNVVVYAIGAPIWISYRIVTDWIMSIEIPPPTRIGGGLRLDHGQGLVIHADTVIGEQCLLRHNTTIGCAMLRDGSAGPAPVFGNRVEVGSNSVIIGDLAIGDDARIGAGSVVTRDVSAGATVVGNPARPVGAATPDSR